MNQVAFVLARPRPPVDAPACRATQLVVLARECTEHGVSTLAARTRLVRGLLTLLDAEACFVFHDDRFAIDGRGPVLDYALAGEGDRVFDVQGTRARSFNPFVASLVPLVREGQVVGRTRTSLVGDGRWYDSLFVRSCARPAGLDDFLASVRSLGGTRVEGIALARRWGAAPFDDDDRRLLVALHEGLGRLFTDPSRAPSLAPRVHATLELVLDGLADKEIAERLAISPHTARQYVKRILRAYGVSSRTQLIARATRRG